MKEKIRQFMEEPLTSRRALKIPLIALGVFVFPYAILVIYANYKSNKAIDEFNEKFNSRKDQIDKMMDNIYLGKCRQEAEIRNDQGLLAFYFERRN